MFSFGRPKPSLGLIFDIGSSSVGAALATFEKDAPTRILYTVRETISFVENPDPDKFFRDMLSALGRVNASVLKDGFRHLRIPQKRGSHRIKHVAYVFSSPWCVTQTKIIGIEKQRAFTFSKTLVARIIAENEKRFGTATIHARPSEIHDRLSVLEKRVVHVSLDGYHVSAPYGKKAKQAEVALFMSLAPKPVIDRVSEVSLTTFHPKDTKMFSSPLVAFSMVRDSFHDTDDFTFLDLGGDISEVSVVKGGLILETVSFPAGLRALVRSVAWEFGMTYGEAESLLRMHSEGHGDAKLATRLNPVLEAASKEWAHTFRTALSRLSHKTSLPRELFVSADADFVHFFIPSIKDEKKADAFGDEGGPFCVNLLNTAQLKGSVTFAPHARRDLSLALVAGFVGRSGI